MPSDATKKSPGGLTRELKDTDASGKVLEFIPQESAEHYQVVPLAVKDGVLEVGAIDPNDIETRDALNFISSRIGMPYKLFLITKKDFDLVIERYKGLSGEVIKALSDLESELSSKIASVEDNKNQDNKDTQ